MPVIGTYLVMDTVLGAEANIAVYEGRIIRTGIVYNPPLGLSLSNPSALVSALAVFGMPQRGDRFPDPAYQDYFCKRHIVRSFSAKALIVNVIYEWHGLLTVQDTSTLANVETQIHPFARTESQGIGLGIGPTPIYVQWKNPNAANQIVIRVANFNTTLPLRHVVASQTIDHQASDLVLQAFGCVNSYPWYGLDVGYWLFSGLEGLSNDNGITYTYTCTFSTKKVEDWRQLEFLRDEHGVSIIADPTTVFTAKLQKYFYGVQYYNGFDVVGMHDVKDFSQIFGFGG